MSIRSVLVVGGGIAGCTLAYWLSHNGFDTTVVELGEGQHSSGSPVDVRGSALAVIEQMNLTAPLREAATQATTLALVDSSGRRIGWIPTQPSANGLELPRGDLAAIRAGALDDLRGPHVDGFAEPGRRAERLRLFCTATFPQRFLNRTVGRGTRRPPALELAGLAVEISDPSASYPLAART